MAKYGKWIGGGLGWALGGPIGGLLGFAVGSMFDNKDGSQAGTQRQRIFTGTTHGDFTMSLLVLVAAVMKADGRVMQSELDYVRDYFNKSFVSIFASHCSYCLLDQPRSRVNKL